MTTYAPPAERSALPADRPPSTSGLLFALYEPGARSPLEIVRFAVPHVAHKMAACGQFFDCYRCSAGCRDGYAVRAKRCKQRLCYSCAKAKAIQDAQRYAPKFERPAGGWVRHYVFSLKNCPTGKLAETVQLLRDSWNRLRKLRPDCFVEGFYSIEFTVNPTTGFWHPHVHALATGYFIDARKHDGKTSELLELWKRATRGAGSIGFVRQVVNPNGFNDLRAQLAEVAKYAAKGLADGFMTWKPWHVREFLEANKNRRLIQPFGKTKVLAKDDAAERACCPSCSEPMELDAADLDARGAALWCVGFLQDAGELPDHEAVRLRNELEPNAPPLAA